MMNPRYYAAFAWALLAALIDYTHNPPKFRIRRDIQCIVHVDNEAVSLSMGWVLHSL